MYAFKLNAAKELAQVYIIHIRRIDRKLYLSSIICHYFLLRKINCTNKLYTVYYYKKKIRNTKYLFFDIWEKLQKKTTFLSYRKW